MLVGGLHATHVSVGENFRFGHRAQGDPDLLRADGRFEVRVVELLEIDGEVVSSSHIRGLVLGGAVEYAGRLLGAPFMVTGEVVHGDERGRSLGFPTANLVPPDGFETLFGTPHGLDLARVATAYGVPVTRLERLDELCSALDGGGVRVVHVRTDRAVNVAVHREINEAVAAALTAGRPRRGAPAA